MILFGHLAFHVNRLDLLRWPVGIYYGSINSIDKQGYLYIGVFLKEDHRDHGNQL